MLHVSDNAYCVFTGMRTRSSENLFLLQIIFVKFSCCQEKSKFLGTNIANLQAEVNAKGFTKPSRGQTFAAKV